MVLAFAIGSFAEEDTHIYDVIVTHVKPEHWYDFKNELKKHPAFEAKHGIEVLGRYKPIAGGIGDLISFMKYGEIFTCSSTYSMWNWNAKRSDNNGYFCSDSMTARVGKLKAIFEDPDFKTHHEKNAHFVDDVTITTSKASALFPAVHPPAPTSNNFNKIIVNINIQ